jgi:hypothetical protein
VPNRQVYESPEFTLELHKLGDIKFLDEKLRGLTCALWVDAEAFALVAPPNRMRVATVRSFGDGPDLSVWFEIDRADDVVLRWIEPIPDGD